MELQNCARKPCFYGPGTSFSGVLKLGRFGLFLNFAIIRILHIFPLHSYMYHHHHHHHRHHHRYHDHHVHNQVHHGQPGHVHGPADAVQANVCRHRPHWKVIMIMITLMTLVMKTFPKANNSDEQSKEDVCTDFKLSFIRFTMVYC